MNRVEEARLALAQAEQAEAQQKIHAVRERMERVLSFDDAEDVIQAGFDGLWIRVDPADQRRIIKSIAGVNLVRGTKSQPYLESYQDRGLLLIVQHFSAIEPHPLNTPGTEPSVKNPVFEESAAKVVMNA